MWCHTTGEADVPLTNPSHHRPLPGAIAAHRGAQIGLLSSASASEVRWLMGIRNYLIEGVSGAGKTTVAEELQRRGHYVIHGDRELSYRGDPATGKAISEPPFKSESEKIAWRHRHWIWNIDRVKSLIADRQHASTFFCGGSRNRHAFIDLFDAVFVLDVDLDTLNKRLAVRPKDEFGGKPTESAFVRQLHSTREDIPERGIAIDATAPVVRVVDQILERCRQVESAGRG